LINSKKVFVTGGAGYIGSVLSGILLEAGYEVILYDCFFFNESSIKNISQHPSLTVVKGDVQDTATVASLLEKGMDVIHLASLSNDPSCDMDPKWSLKINHEATVNLAIAAKEKGCRRFVYASSCSVYGFGGEEILTETSLCNPVSLYADLKLRSEESIMKMADKSFCPVLLRQATIFGLSPRMRFDLAINQMTMHAITRGKIFVMGGGEQWRPFLHVRDSARLFKACLEAPREDVFSQVFNAGSDENNFQIVELAELVSRELEDIEVVVAPDDTDRRSYNVDFSKIKRVLGFTPKENISNSISEIADYIKDHPSADFNSSEYFNVKRLQEITSHFNVLQGYTPVKD